MKKKNEKEKEIKIVHAGVQWASVLKWTSVCYPVSRIRLSESQFQFQFQYQ